MSEDAHGDRPRGVVTRTGQAWPLFAGRRAVLATKHGKLPLIAPPLAAAVGLDVTAVPVDTDTPGTFTGEVPRPGPPLATAVAKARLAMESAWVPLGLASEGSIGPHPDVPFCLTDAELVVLVSPDGLARAQTDLRAHACPSRRPAIAAAAADLARRAGSLVPGVRRAGLGLGRRRDRSAV